MKKPKISIIVAVYNTAQYLDKCMLQLLNQTMNREEYEIIIVDDCSTDDSAEILNGYAADNENIKIIYKEKNEGTFWSRVDGMKEACGDYIGFVDSDDWIDTDMYEILSKTAEEQKADIVECGYQDDDGKNCESHFQLKEGHYTRIQIVKLFTERIINASLWMRLYHRKLIVKILHDTVNTLNREEYRGIRNEDEFLFPLLLNEADSYVAVHAAPYHYRIDSSGSIMSAIQENVQKKVYHGETVIHAGELMLKKTEKDSTLRPYYLYLQTNNIFYLLGIIKKNQLDMNEYKSIFKRHFGEVRRWKQSPKLLFRNIHLYLRYKQLSED